MSDYLLPDVGEGLTEAEIVSWKVAVGDEIAVNDIVVEIETAKSLVELPSPYAGSVLALLVAEGETVDVGTAIISIGDPSAVVATPPGSGAPVLEIDLSNPAASGSMEGASLVGRIKADRGPVRRPRHGSASLSSASAAATQMQVQGAFAPGGARSPDVVEADEPAVPAVSARDPEPVSEFVPARATSPAAAAAARALAKPPVRRLAKDLGVDLAGCRASGPGGTVTRADVQAAAAPATVEQAPATRPIHRERESREPVKGVRRMMAAAMVESAFTAPHVTEWVTVDVTATMQLVERLRARRELREVKVGPLLVLARAVLLAMRRTPEINSAFDQAAQEVVYKRYVNLGIAAATPRGLVVPHVKDAQDLSLVELATELDALTATARAGRTQPAQMTGGTFTITNVGVFGIDAGTPIINPGESAILCFGAIRRQPWVVQAGGVEQVVPRDVTTLALSFDHRHVDGEQGSRFLADVAGILADPGTALLY